MNKDTLLAIATKILGEAEAKNWVYRKVPSLNNQAPLDLLDTETGCHLVEQVLLQIKHGMYV